MTGAAAGLAEIGTLHRTADGNICTAMLERHDHLRDRKKKGGAKCGHVL